MSNTIIMGADPGLFGAFTKLDPINHTLEIFDSPIFTIKTGKKTKNVLDPVGVGNILNDERIAHIYLEEVGSRPGQSISATFTFGTVYGIVQGACGALQVPYTLVRPQKWKAELKVPAEKNAARYRASQLFPQCAKAWSRSKDDGRAEASLLALYGMSLMGYKVEKPFTLIGDLAQ